MRQLHLAVIVGLVELEGGRTVPEEGQFVWAGG